MSVNKWTSSWIRRLAISVSFLRGVDLRRNIHVLREKVAVHHQVHEVVRAVLVVVATMAILA